MTMLQTVAYVQAGYFAATGIWPWVHMGSFLAVTGPKTDLWLVKTVGLLVLAVAIPLAMAGWTGRVMPEVICLAVASAAMLGFADAWFSLRGVSSKIYLLDAVAEVVLIALWCIALAR